MIKVPQVAITDVLSGFGTETETVGRSVEDESDRADAILEVAAGLVGRRRSPTGEALSSDTTQTVVLNFDEYVVTVSE